MMHFKPNIPPHIGEMNVTIIKLLAKELAVIRNTPELKKSATDYSLFPE